jgi:acyl-coenzyme A thioesterase PaaI-like protein
MDYAFVRTMLEAIPFNGHLGIEIVEVADGTSVARLPEAAHLHNHVATQHAGALFTVAEAASGAAFGGAFADRMATLRPLAKSATIAYLKIARGPITAKAKLAEDKAAILARLDSDGRAEFPVEVELFDSAGVLVAKVSVQWHIKAAT